jgi:hypothetical protein
MQTPREVLNEWMEGINKGNVDAVIGLYHQDAVLIPTFSSRMLNTPDKIQWYFDRFREYRDLSIALHEKTLMIQQLVQGYHALCGIYCWRFMIDEEMFNFEARFSYTVNVAEDRPILHHHSSQIPRTLT